MRTGPRAASAAGSGAEASRATMRCWACSAATLCASLGAGATGSARARSGRRSCTRRCDKSRSSRRRRRRAWRSRRRRSPRSSARRSCSSSWPHSRRRRRGGRRRRRPPASRRPACSPRTRSACLRCRRRACPPTASSMPEACRRCRPTWWRVCELAAESWRRRGARGRAPHSDSRGGNAKGEGGGGERCTAPRSSPHRVFAPARGPRAHYRARERDTAAVAIKSMSR
mmetsp:Transcript_43271/g.139682  ORF Transcript_43271/g.139682 Transcript_43271/m.139682 type:complete len:228 (+) Transcript_43271:677-1360(+)